MLEKLPSGLGRALQGLRAGLDAITFNSAEVVEVPDTLQLSSPAFQSGEPLPARFTEDGERMSPPLRWSGVPAETQALVLLVEDADSPTPQPLVHAIVTGLPPRDDALDEDDLPGPAGGPDGDPVDTAGMGRNSFLKAGWLPPDPPSGHGAHRYCFQIFALDTVPDFDGAPGRGALRDALRGHVLAKGMLIGTYARP
ncbi:YbhB/YbcL family Raf kinase inhibitor-like protein [Roseomonas elaeocarpi]|uniref:YbhB/YbcL family Raf kinase inhibitor-like protein n=1 Tax=Roseomonas elaeocarpi TaxID=907779 RepID=A0ABV6JT00_9PROT